MNINIGTRKVRGTELAEGANSSDRRARAVSKWCSIQKLNSSFEFQSRSGVNTLRDKINSSSEALKKVKVGKSVFEKMPRPKKSNLPLLTSKDLSDNLDRLLDSPLLSKSFDLTRNP